MYHIYHLGAILFILKKIARGFKTEKKLLNWVAFSEYLSLISSTNSFSKVIIYNRTKTYNFSNRLAQLDHSKANTWRSFRDLIDITCFSIHSHRITFWLVERYLNFKSCFQCSRLFTCLCSISFYSWKSRSNNIWHSWR